MGIRDPATLLDPAIPLWLKIAYTIFVSILVPVYLKHWGPKNFLWFSDLALFATLVALWLESGFIATMVAVGILLPEIVWNVSFFGRLLTGKDVSFLAAYMFEPEKPLYVRALSLFHVFLPPLVLWLIYKLGYAERAWIAQMVVAWLVLPLTYAVTDRAGENVNWVHAPPGISQRVYFLLIMLGFPLLVYFPTHLILRALFG